MDSLQRFVNTKKAFSLKELTIVMVVLIFIVLIIVGNLTASQRSLMSKYNYTYNRLQGVFKRLVLTSDANKKDWKSDKNSLRNLECEMKTKDGQKVFVSAERNYHCLRKLLLVNENGTMPCTKNSKHCFYEPEKASVELYKQTESGLTKINYSLKNMSFLKVGNTVVGLSYLDKTCSGKYMLNDVPICGLIVMDVNHIDKPNGPIATFKQGSDRYVLGILANGIENREGGTCTCKNFNSKYSGTRPTCPEDKVGQSLQGANQCGVTLSCYYCKKKCECPKQPNNSTQIGTFEYACLDKKFTCDKYECNKGFILNEENGNCFKNPCQNGFSWNYATKKCQECICTYPNISQHATNKQYIILEKDCGQYSCYRCIDGYTLDNETGYCKKNICKYNEFYNVKTAKCELIGQCNNPEKQLAKTSVKVNGTNQTCFAIKKQNDFNCMRNSSANFCLDNNIKLCQKCGDDVEGWTSYNGWSSIENFKGKFFGNKHSIDNLRNSSFFKNLSNSIIQDLTFNSAFVSNSLLASKIDNSNISNILINSSRIQGTQQVAGIALIADNSSISNTLISNTNIRETASGYFNINSKLNVVAGLVAYAKNSKINDNIIKDTNITSKSGIVTGFVGIMAAIPNQVNLGMLNNNTFVGNVRLEGVSTALNSPYKKFNINIPAGTTINSTRAIVWEGELSNSSNISPNIANYSKNANLSCYVKNHSSMQKLPACEPYFIKYLKANPTSQQYGSLLSSK